MKIAALVCLAFLACSAPPPVAPEPAAPEEVPDPPWLRIGISVEGRPIRCADLGDGDTVLIVAGIHGNEAAGTPPVERLAVELARSADGLDVKEAFEAYGAMLLAPIRFEG